MHATHKSMMVLTLCLTLGLAQGQEILTLEQAIDAALTNNYDIKLERYNAEVSENNVSRALSGQRPTVELTASYEWGYSDAELETLGAGEGPSAPLELDGTANEILLRNQVSIPIFQGFRGRYTYRQLQNLSYMSELQLRRVTEQTISQTVASYLQVSRIQGQLAISESNISLSYDRWQRAQADAAFGSANSLRVLQAVVDLNTDSAEYRTALLDYENAKRDLNVVLVRGTETNYAVEEQVALVGTLHYDQLLAEMKANNAQLQLSQGNVQNAFFDTKINDATKMPTIQGYANVTYFDSQDEASFLQDQTVFGPNLGVQMNFPVFTGGANRIRRQNARVQLEQQRMSLKNTEQLLERDLSNAFARYQNNKEQLRIERSNLPAFEKNFEKAADDYRLGQVDETVLRTAQVNLSMAKNRINNLEYGVKQSEITLLQISGQLKLEN